MTLLPQPSYCKFVSSAILISAGRGPGAATAVLAFLRAAAARLLALGSPLIDRRPLPPALAVAGGAPTGPTALALSVADFAGPAARLRTVEQARTLGVAFRNDALAVPVHLSGVTDALARVARLPLTTFGLAAAASAYALSKALYHMEFQGLPPRAEMARLLGLTAAVVDRKMSPAMHAATPSARLVGVSLEVLALPPAVGGFGLLPLVAHIQARTAVAAVRCVAGAAGLLPADPLWAAVALRLLRQCHPAAHPLCLLAPGEGRVLGVAAPRGCPAFTRLLGASARLGPPVVLDPDAMTGPWCFSAPLWGNPALLGPGGACLEAVFPDLFVLRGFTTLGVAVRCWDALAPVRAALAAAVRRPAGVSPRVARQCTLLVRQRMLRGVLAYRDLGPAVNAHGPSVSAHLDALLALVPASWVAAARLVSAGAAAAPPAQEAWAALLRGLAWGPAGGPFTPVLGTSVKRGTQLQLAAAYQDLKARHVRFLADAYEGAVPQQAFAVFRDTLRRLWELRWENGHKEALWRLAAHGIAGFPLMQSHAGRGRAAACPCGTAVTGAGACWVRRHLFWDCFVARTLREELEAAMAGPAASSVPVVERSHLWLVLPPRGIHPRVWDVVALAAVAALERGRQRMYRGGCVSRPAPPRSAGWYWC